MLSPDEIFALVYAYFQSCALMFNNYLIIFMIYTLATYAGETLFKYEARTYWYDRLITPLIIGTYLLHSFLLFDGVVNGDFWLGSIGFFNALGHYTNALEVTWFVFIIAFLIFWVLRLLIYGVHLRVIDTPARVIKNKKKFNRIDSAMVLILIGIFMVQGWNTYENSVQFNKEEKAKAKEAKANVTPQDYKKAQEMLEEVQALINGTAGNHHVNKKEESNEVR